MREAFEDWFACGDPGVLEREGGGYRLLMTENAWQAWRAGWIARDDKEGV